ncbi:MAG: TonB C-terminal domain-containing protein [Pseudomonadota bacterium]
MIRRSVLIAMAALAVSLLVHFFGLGMTLAVEAPPRQLTPATNAVAVSNAFEDIAETAPDPVEPEPAPVPTPEVETPPPEPDLAETPTSEALVASNDPQAVSAPDTGSAPLAQPETAGSVEPEVGETPDPEVLEPSSGAGEQVAEAPAAAPAGTDSATEIPQGETETDASAAEPAPVTPTAPPTAAAEPQRLAALPTPQVVQPPVALSPVDPAVPVVPLAPAPPEPEEQSEIAEPPPTPAQTDPADKDAAEASPQAVTTSLRPRERAERPRQAPLGATDGLTNLRTSRLAPSELIESPLTSYQRDGNNVFAGRRGGSRSSGLGFRDDRGPGNSDVTNYAGAVLAHVNRTPPIAVSARGWARVFFEINPDGSLAWIDVIDGSNSIEVERAAKAQLQSAVPLPRPPGGKSRKLNFVYRID